MEIKSHETASSPETLIDIEVEEKVGKLPTFYSVYVLGEDVDGRVG